MVKLLLGAISSLALLFSFVFGKDLKENRDKSKNSMIKIGFGIGFITDFLDAIGIGSFAVTTAIFKFHKKVDISDKLLPGTLNVAHSLPMVVQALLTLTVIEVDAFTLVSMIVSSVIGSWIGAGIISKLPEKTVRLTMAIALIVTAFMLSLAQLNLMPSGGEALGLEGSKLVIAILGNFVLGALMTAGIGLYAPCLALVSLLGMNPKAAFPIMAGACAALGPMASIKFIKEKAYEREISFGIALGGVIGSTIAILFISNMPVYWLKWLVVIVCLYTAATMIKQLKSSKQEECLEQEIQVS